MKDNSPYYIVLVADEGYVQHAGVMLTSLFEHNSDKDFRVYLLTDGISEMSQDRLTTLCRHYGGELRVCLCSEDGLEELPVGQWSTMMYYKLFMPVMLPREAERCLFLDVDMVVNDDIEPLYHFDLQGRVLAAAEDMPDCVHIKPRIGLEQTDLYVNSGVMVCDLVRWREMEAVQPIFAFVRSVADRIVNEQDVIALYFRGRIGVLPIRWNMVTFYFNRVPKIFPKYLPELAEAKRNPGIVHFCAPIKPWFCDSQHPYRSLYRHYLRLYGQAAGCAVNLRFPYGEQLTPRQRVNKTIRNFLNRIGLMRDVGYTPGVK